MSKIVGNTDASQSPMKSVQPVDTAINTPAPTVKETQDNELLNIVRNLQKEVESLKTNKHQKSKEIYKGPKFYCYKIWGGVPVLGYESFKPDNTKDLVYKKGNNEWISNHFLHVHLQDGTDVDVEVNEFARSCDRSGKLPCEVKTDGDEAISYTFHVEGMEPFTVSANAIN